MIISEFFHSFLQSVWHSFTSQVHISSVSLTPSNTHNWFHWFDGSKSKSNYDNWRSFDMNAANYSPHSLVVVTKFKHRLRPISVMWHHSLKKKGKKRKKKGKKSAISLTNISTDQIKSTLFSMKFKQKRIKISIISINIFNKIHHKSLKRGKQKSAKSLINISTDQIKSTLFPRSSNKSIKISIISINIFNKIHLKSLLTLEPLYWPFQRTTLNFKEQTKT